MSTRIVLWTGWHALALSDADLDRYAAMGIGGWAVSLGYAPGLGGDGKWWTQVEPTLKTFTQRANARGMRVWLGVRTTSYNSPTVPLADWFDDVAWQKVTAALASTAAVAARCGCTGLAVDGEPYHSGGWPWNYTGNTHTEAEVRAAARKRGAQVMRALVVAQPRIGLLAYYLGFPAGWMAKIQVIVNHAVNPYADRLDVNFWDGMTSVAGYGAVRFLDSTFYKGTGGTGTTLEQALALNRTELPAYFATHFSGWAAASTQKRITVSPFVWIDAGPTASAWDDLLAPDRAAALLLGCAKDGSGMVAIYDYGNLKQDYTAYAAGIRAASLA